MMGDDVRKATLTASLELDDGTLVPATVEAGSPATGGRIMMRFALSSVPPGRRIAAATVRNDDLGAEFARRFDPRLPLPRAGGGDTMTLIFTLDDVTAFGDLLS
jgi:hypothetical protein